VQARVLSLERHATFEELIYLGIQETPDSCKSEVTIRKCCLLSYYMPLLLKETCLLSVGFILALVFNDTPPFVKNCMPLFQEWMLNLIILAPAAKNVCCRLKCECACLNECCLLLCFW